MQLNDNGKVIVKVMSVILVCYVVIFLIWNLTSPSHRPTGLLWDFRKEGYKANPIDDRWKRE